MSLKKVIVAILLAYVGIMFLVGVTPSIEGIATTNITNSVTLVFFNMAKWLLPVGGLVGIFYGVFKLFGSSGKAGD